MKIVLSEDKELVEEIRKIHDLTPTTTAAMGRFATISGMMGLTDIKQEDDSITIQIKGEGPMGLLVSVIKRDDKVSKVKVFTQDPHVELPLKENGKIDINIQEVFEAEKEAILELSAKQNCVIVGRCSDYILHSAKRPNLFSVHIYAPVHVRKNFGMQELGILPDKIDDYIIRVDSGRSEFYKRHTGVSFNSQKYRDVMINSEYLTKDQIAEAICTMAKFRFSESK